MQKNHHKPRSILDPTATTTTTPTTSTRDLRLRPIKKTRFTKTTALTKPLTIPSASFSNNNRNLFGDNDDDDHLPFSWAPSNNNKPTLNKNTQSLDKNNNNPTNNNRINNNHNNNTNNFRNNTGNNNRNNTNWNNTNTGNNNSNNNSFSSSSNSNNNNNNFNGFKRSNNNNNSFDNDMSKRNFNGPQGDSRGGNKHHRGNDNRHDNRHDNRGRNNNDNFDRRNRDDNRHGGDRNHFGGESRDNEMVRVNNFNRELFLLQVPYKIPLTVNAATSIPPSATLEFAPAFSSKKDDGSMDDDENIDLGKKLEGYGAESLADPVLDMALNKRAAGINKCITPHPSYHGLVKHNHEDFIVQEIYAPLGNHLEAEKQKRQNGQNVDQNGHIGTKIATLRPISRAHILPDPDVDNSLNNEERHKGLKMEPALTQEAMDKFRSIVKNDQVAEDFFDWYRNAAQDVLQKHYSKLVIDSIRRELWVQRRKSLELEQGKGMDDLDGELPQSDNSEEKEKNEENGDEDKTEKEKKMDKKGSGGRERQMENREAARRIFDNFTQGEITIPVLSHLERFFPKEVSEDENKTAKGTYTNELPEIFVDTPFESAQRFYTTTLTNADLVKFQTNYRAEYPPFRFSFPEGQELSKEGRTMVHQFFKDYFPLYLLSDTKLTEPIPGEPPHPKTGKVPTRGVMRCFLHTMNSKKRGEDDDGADPTDSVDNRSLRELYWYPGPDTKYMHFTLEKRDYDTLSAIAQVNKNLGFGPHKITQLFGTAGIKDRRAITLQRVSVEETTAMKILYALYDPAAVKKLLAKSIKDKEARESTSSAVPIPTETSLKPDQELYDERFYDSEFDIRQKVYQYQSGYDMKSPSAPVASGPFKQQASASWETQEGNPLNRSNAHAMGTKTLRTLHAGNFNYEATPIQSGDLKGNQFTILMKDIQSYDRYAKRQLKSFNGVKASVYDGENHPPKWSDPIAPNQTQPKPDQTQAPAAPFVMNDDSDDDGGIPMIKNSASSTESLEVLNANRPVSQSYLNWQSRVAKSINFSSPLPPTQPILGAADTYTPSQLSNVVKEMTTTLEGIQNVGFLNYYGEQRFGKNWNTYTFGWLFLTGRYTKLIQTLLAPNSGDRPDLRLMKQHLVGDHVTFPFEKMTFTSRDENHNTSYREGGWDVSAAASILNRGSTRTSFPAESAIVDGLWHGIDPRDVTQLVSRIPSTLTTLYSHAYQSYIWNNAASARMDPDFMGLTIDELQKPIVGDLVLVKGIIAQRSGLTALKQMKEDERGDKNDKRGGRDGRGRDNERGDNNKDQNKDQAENKNDKPDDDSKGFSFDSEVALVTADDVHTNKYSLSDVILPNPGMLTYFPTHKAGKLMLQAMGRDGVLLKGTRLDPFDGVTPNNDNSQYYIAPDDADLNVTNFQRGNMQGLGGLTVAGSYRALIKKPSQVKYRFNIKVAGVPTPEPDNNSKPASFEPRDVEFEYNISKSGENDGQNQQFHLRVKQFALQPPPKPRNIFDLDDETQSLPLPIQTTITSYPTIDECIKATIDAFEANNETVVKSRGDGVPAVIPQTKFDLNINFGLDPSTYATVFLREILGGQPLTYSPHSLE